MKIIFFGTPPFAAEVLDFLIMHNITISAVVTKPDRPKGRSGTATPTAVSLMVKNKYPSIPLYHPEKISAPGESELLLPYEADLFVVVAYGEIIKEHLLNMPKLGCINLHASLLPSYRGAAPIQQAIINGETVSGITIMHMVKKMDAGDMIKCVSVPIAPDIDFGTYEKLLCQAGSKALLEVILEFNNGKVLGTAQNAELATFAPKIELESCQIDWSKSALDIHNLVRGTNPYPGAWCMVEIKGEKKRLKIWKTRVEDAFEGSPGKLLPTKKHALTVACGKGALEILELQLEGKKAMPAELLLRGLPVDAIHLMA